jgi:tetratricopeptide (TPR) repeat protein
MVMAGWGERRGAQLALLFALLGVALAARAETSLPRLLEALELREHDDVFEIAIRFTTPVRYLRHAPFELGDTIQIQVAPVSLDPGSAPALARRESLPVPPGWPVPLVEVVYEGDRSDGRFVVVRFAHDVSFQVRPGADFRSLLVTVRPSAKTTLPGEPAPLPADEGTALRKSDELMATGRRALAEGDLDEAVRIFTKITALPEHGNSPEAKELLGVARERKGQIAHAKAEYEEYLQWYPDGEGAERVRQRLAALLSAHDKPAKSAAPTSSYADVDYFGSLGTQYRREELDDTITGNSMLDSSLLTDLSASARVRSESWVLRGLTTGSYRQDFLPGGGATQARVTSLYFDATERGGPWSGTLGRQPGNTAGLPSRFDGLRLSNQLDGDWRLSLRGGLPVELTTSDRILTNRYLYGLSLDYSRGFERGVHAGHVDAQLFGLQQRADGLIDRTGVGSELRYVDDSLFIASYGDYDLHFKRLNTALVTSNWQVSPDTSLNLYLDYRFSPLLVTSNALQGQPVSQLSELQKLYSNSQIDQLALDRTPRSISGSVGGSHRLSDDLQLALDVSGAKLGATQGSAGVEGTPATGWEMSYYPQLIASSFFTQGDVATLGLRYFQGTGSDTISLITTERYPVTPTFRLLPRFRVDWRNHKGTDEFAPTPDQIQNDPIAAAAAARARNGALSVRPFLGFDWRIGKVTLDGEAGVEWTNASFDPAAGNQFDWSVALGVRYDF